MDTPTNGAKCALWKKILEARRAIPALDKNSYDTFLNRNYTNNEDLVKAVKAACDGVGLLLYPILQGCEQTTKQNKTANGKEFTTAEAKVTLSWIALDPDTGESEAFPWTAYGTDTTERAIGRALSYASRAFLLKFFLIACAEAEEEDSHKQPTKPAPARQPQKLAPAKPVQPNILIPDISLLDWGNAIVDESLLPNALKGKGLSFRTLLDVPEWASEKDGKKYTGRQLVHFWERGKDKAIAEVASALLAQFPSQPAPTTPEPPATPAKKKTTKAPALAPAEAAV